MSYDPKPRPIIEGEFGMTVMPMGVVKFRESFRFFSHVLSGEAAGDPDPERVRDIETAFNHEFVHLLQSFTTSAGFIYSEQVRYLVGQVIKYIHQDESFNKIFYSAKHEYSLLLREMKQRTGRTRMEGLAVSVNDLLEDMAVIESFRATVGNSNVVDLLGFMPKEGNGNGYGRILGIMMRQLGPEPTIKLTSTICFLSLCSPNPGESFAGIVNRLYSIDPSVVSSMSSLDLFDMFAPNTTESLISLSASGKDISTVAIWNKISKEFATCGENALVHLCAANPSSLLAKSNWSGQLDAVKLSFVAPLLTIFEDGLGKANASLSLDQVSDVLAATSLVGAVLCIVDNSRPAVVCSLQECPVRETGLCHYHYPPAPGSDWRECSFHGICENAFRRKPLELHHEIEVLNKQCDNDIGPEGVS